MSTATGPASPAPSDAAKPARRVDGSMSLLVDMMANTLDESYAEAARRKSGSAGEGPAGSSSARTGTSGTRRLTAALLLVGLGVVTGTAAAQVRTREAAGSGLRAELVADVQRRTSESDALAAATARLRSDVAAQQDAALRSNSAGAAVARDLAALELAVGVDPVTGPGLVVRLDDAPGSKEVDVPRGGQSAEGRILDRDLQEAVNGLWAAGAEAVAINGLRLSTFTAIRSAGEAILVDYRPLSPPYTVRAIGDPGTLEARFADSAAGRRLSSYTSLYGLQMEIRRSDGQTLPGAGTPTLRVARPLPSPTSRATP